MRHRSLSGEDKWRILQHDGFACAWCGNTTKTKLDVGHIVPHSRGGTEHLNNLAASCAQCNRDTGTTVNVPARFCTDEVDSLGWRTWKRWGSWVLQWLPDSRRGEPQTIWEKCFDGDNSCDISLTFQPLDYWIALERVHDSSWHDHLECKTWMRRGRSEEADEYYQDRNWNDFCAGIEFARTLIYPPSKARR